MQAPKSIYIIAIIFLLWNLMGDAAYLMQVTQDLNELAKADAYQASLFRTMPQWAWAAYAIAVWVGTLASVLLLLRRRIAAPLFALSVAAAIAQFGRTFLMTDLLAVKGPSTAIFPAIVVIIGLIEFLYARSSAAKGWLR